MAGCSDGQNATLGASPLMRLHDGAGTYAQRIHKELPGTLGAETGAGGAVDGGVAAEELGPTVNVETTPGWVHQGQSNGKYAARLSEDAVAVGVAIPDVEEGYWVKPAGAPDSVTKELTWDAYLAVSDDVEAGYHDVNLVAIDQFGNAGRVVTYPLCVRSRVPDNLNACDPSLDAPNAVISLKWDSNVDLDLQVVDSAGNVIDAKHPASIAVGDAVDAGVAVLDRDSNAGCLIDGIRYENVVWNTSKPKGRYGIYVNLFSACGKPSVHFEVAVYVAKTVSDAGQRLTQFYSQSGVLLDFQANGGDGRGLFITEFEF
jgi:hypothetical protein